LNTASRESDEEQEEKGAKKKAKRRNKKGSAVSQEGAPPAEEVEDGFTNPKFKEGPDKRNLLMPPTDLAGKIKKKKKLKYNEIKQLDADDLFSYITGDTPKEDGKKQQKAREKRIQS
jgi:hypothetical protein